MKAFMYMVGYNSDFKKQCNTGWGCGYVAIPMDSNAVKMHFKRIADEEEAQKGDEWAFVDKYFRHAGLEQEITLTEVETIDGNEYLTIGFDTAHRYNNDFHDFNYVFSETVKILNLINEINADDGIQEAE